MANNTEKKKILITGGSGFIGQHLVKKLEDQGHSVEVFDLINGQDLLNSQQVDEAIKGKDVVFHLAAIADLYESKKNPSKNMNINVVGTINVAEACLKHKAILNYASTCCVYGNPEVHPSVEKSLPNPTEIYACSKLAGEYVILGYAKTCGLKYNIMRFATIYGPGMRSALATYVFLDQAIKGLPITVHGTGKQTRTLTFTEDLVDGMIEWFNSGITDEIVNLTTEEEISVLETIEMIKKMTGSKSEIVFLPERQGQIFREQIEAQKALALFGWKAKHTFEEGMAKTYKWFLENEANKK
ncbi:MAG: NAD-dependent epimerase/dehydratase family protein [Candidatus Paceibacterota bacterium]|jgi:UDP-glucose 4-epimerase